MPDLSNLPTSVEIALQVALIVVTVLVAYVVLRAAVGISVRHIIERRSAENGDAVLPPAELERRVSTVGRLVVRVGGSLIVVIGVLMALNLFGIDIGPAVAGLGVVGIAVGFGAQTLVRDWLAGMFVILESQYSQGDIVRIAGVEGVVEDFSLRRTTLRDLDGSVHIVPNGQIVVASNLTRLWGWLSLDVRVSHGADVDRATEIINRTGESLKTDAAWGSRVLEIPSVARVSPLGESGVTLSTVAQVRAAERTGVTDELRRRILDALKSAGIETAD